MDDRTTSKRNSDKTEFTTTEAESLSIYFAGDLSSYRTASPQAFHALLMKRVDSLGLSSREQCLDLSGLQSLDRALSKAILLLEPENLVLDGILSLSPEVAEMLGQLSKSRIFLNGIQELCPEASLRLAGSDGHFFLRGLKQITVETARNLKKFRGRLSVGAQTLVNDDVLKALAECSADLALPGITAVSPKLLEAFGENRGYLDLSGLQNLDLAQAKALCRSQDNLHRVLNGLRGMDNQTLEVLIERMGRTSLTGIEHCTSEQFEKIVKTSARPGRSIDLSGLRALPDATLHALHDCTWNLDLRGLATLTPACAEVLAHGQHSLLEFSHLNNPSDDVAQILISESSPAGLSPQGWEQRIALREGQPNRKTRVSLIRNHWRFLYHVVLGGLTSPSIPVCRALARTEKMVVVLPDVTRLSPDQATLLSEAQRAICLPSLTELSHETAQALRDGLGSLILPNLGQLDLVVATVIAQSQSSISLPGIQQLTVEQAKILAHSKTRELEFPNIADLSSEVAAALVDRQPVMVGESSEELDESPLPHFSKMTFYGLKRVQQKAFEILSRTSYCRFPSSCIEELTPQVAELLTHHEEGHIHIPASVCSISPEIAEILVTPWRTLTDRSPHIGLQLRGLTELSEELASVLAQYQGRLLLTGVRHLSVAVCKILSRHEGGLLDLSGVEQMSDECIQWLTIHRPQVRLGGLQSLSTSAAHYLSAHPYPLVLSNVQILDDAAWNHLAKHRAVWDSYNQPGSFFRRGFYLHLENLEHFTDAAADVLTAQQGGSIHLGYPKMSEHAYQALHRKWGTRMQSMRNFETVYSRPNIRPSEEAS